MCPLLPKPRLDDLPDCHIRYYPGFLTEYESDGLFHNLRNDTPWQQDSISLFGKTYQQPRLTALYGEKGRSYSYSGITMLPHPFSTQLYQLKKKVEEFSGNRFSSCLLNLYRDGSDSNGWHADNEPELGDCPVIASLSLGAVRRFQLKHRRRRELKLTMELHHGSLLLMQGPTQHHWLHQVPKTRKEIGERINLTFRLIQ